MKTLFEIGKVEGGKVETRLDVTHDNVVHNVHEKSFHGNELRIDSLRD